MEVYRKKRSPQSKRVRLAASITDDLKRRVAEMKRQMGCKERNDITVEGDNGGKEGFPSHEGEEIPKGTKKKRVLGAVSGQSEEWAREDENCLWSTRMKEEEELLCARLGFGSGPGFEEGS